MAFDRRAYARAWYLRNKARLAAMRDSKGRRVVRSAAFKSHYRRAKADAMLEGPRLGRQTPGRAAGNRHAARTTLKVQIQAGLRSGRLTRGRAKAILRRKGWKRSSRRWIQDESRLYGL